MYDSKTNSRNAFLDISQCQWGGRRWFGDNRCAFVKVYKANNLLELVSKFGNVATTNGFLITKWLSMVDRNNIMK